MRRKTLFRPLPQPDCKDGIRTNNSPRGDGNASSVKAFPAVAELLELTIPREGTETMLGGVIKELAEKN